MTLMYWREYRTEFHIAQSYGVSESTVCRTIQKVEDVLARSWTSNISSLIEQRRNVYVHKWMIWILAAGWILTCTGCLAHPPRIMR